MHHLDAQCIPQPKNQAISQRETQRRNAGGVNPEAVKPRDASRPPRETQATAEPNPPTV